MAPVTANLLWMGTAVAHQLVFGMVEVLVADLSCCWMMSQYSEGSI